MFYHYLLFALLVVLSVSTTALHEGEDNEVQRNVDKNAFEDYFVHKVMHFDGNDDDGEISITEKEPYKMTHNWRRGWKRYPLYIIILGG